MIGRCGAARGWRRRRTHRAWKSTQGETVPSGFPVVGALAAGGFRADRPSAFQGFGDFLHFPHSHRQSAPCRGRRNETADLAPAGWAILASSILLVMTRAVAVRPPGRSTNISNSLVLFKIFQRKVHRLFTHHTGKKLDVGAGIACNNHRPLPRVGDAASRRRVSPLKESIAWAPPRNQA